MPKDTQSAKPNRLIRSYLSFVKDRSWLPLLVALALATASVSIVSRIEIDPSLEALLPQDTEAQRALEELRDRIPSSSPYFLLVESPDPTLNRKLSRKILEAVSAWPDTRKAINRRDPTYFLDRRLLFLSSTDLRDLADRAEELVQWQQCDAMPGCVNLEEKPRPIDADDLRELYTNTPQVRAFLDLLGIESPPDPQPVVDRSTGSVGAESKVADGKALSGDLCSADGTVCAIHVVLDGEPFDLDYAQSVLTRTDALFASITPSPKPKGLKLAASGEYRVTPTIKRSVVADLSKVGVLSTVLLLIIVLIQFRGLRAFLFIFVPLIVCGACTLGLVALLHPVLNIISAFTLAVLAGLGIDFGVHLLTHYGQARAQEMPPLESLCHTFSSLGSSMLVAATTTGCGFASLVAARFRGFSEMGLLAAVGIALALVTYLLLFPPLVLLAHRLVPERSSPLRSLRPIRLSGKGFSLPPSSIVIVGIGLACIGVAIGTNLEFEYNFRNLRPKVVSHGIDWKRALHGTIRTAIVMMSDDRASLEKAATAIRKENLDDLTRKTPPLIITPSSFIPADQQNRLAQIRRLRDAVDKGIRHAKPEQRKKLEKWKPLLEIEEPIGEQNLPDWVYEWLRERDSRFGNFGVIYSDLAGSNALQMERLMNRIHRWQKKYPKVRFASRVALLGVVVPGLRADAPVIILLALFGLCIGTIVVSRSFRRTLLVLLPLTGALCIAIGIMVLVGLKINLYNMLIFPLAFGIGIDGAIYVVWSAQHARQHNDRRFQTASQRAVLGSTMTTLAGFGSMTISQNPGLASLGWMSIITLSMTLLINLVWLPALLKWKPSLLAPKEAQGEVPTNEPRVVVDTARNLINKCKGVQASDR